MKRVLMLLVLGALLLAGCETTVETATERNRRIRYNSDLEWRMLVEDWDYFWMNERTTGMTQWHPWVGL